MVEALLTHTEFVKKEVRRGEFRMYCLWCWDVGPITSNQFSPFTAHQVFTRSLSVQL